MTTENVWHEWQSAVRSFLEKRVSDANVADDLVQEVFLRIHRGMSSLTDEEKIAPWIFRIARNVWTDYLRRNSTRTTGEGVEHWPQIASEAEEIAETVFARCIANMVDRLPDVYREAVKYAELQGLTQNEIAARLQLSLSGAKSRVQRGRQLLKEMVLDCCCLEFDRRGRIVDWVKRSLCEDDCSCK